MPAFAATAPGKIILFGEHAVVYGRPAIAVPVTQVCAKVTVIATPAAKPGLVQIIARGIGVVSNLDHLAEDNPLAMAIGTTAQTVGERSLPAMRIEISSTIPIAAGLGSGTAVSAAIARALSAFLGHPLADTDISRIAFQVDHLHHGTPSGIDNTVIAYSQPVFYVRDLPFERLQVHLPITFVIGNTGIPSPTGAVVEHVRQNWIAAREETELLFDQIGQISFQARMKIEQGPVDDIGVLMVKNQHLLKLLGVSSPELDQLINAALSAGASGAKLCGGGRGGNMIALVAPDTAGAVARALREAGAVNTITTTITP